MLLTKFVNGECVYEVELQKRRQRGKPLTPARLGCHLIMTWTQHIFVRVRVRVGRTRRTLQDTRGCWSARNRWHLLGPRKADV